MKCKHISATDSRTTFCLARTVCQALLHPRCLVSPGDSNLLSNLGLDAIDLNVTALLPSPSCPNGGLLNAALGLGDNCVGITAAGPNGLVQTCGLLQGSDTCCCSSGDHRSTLPGHLTVKAVLALSS